MRCGEVPGCLMYRGRSYGGMLLVACMDRELGFSAVRKRILNSWELLPWRRKGMRWTSCPEYCNSV